MPTEAATQFGETLATVQRRLDWLKTHNQNNEDIPRQAVLLIEEVANSIEYITKIIRDNMTTTTPQPVQENTPTQNDGTDLIEKLESAFDDLSSVFFEREGNPQLPQAATSAITGAITAIQRAIDAIEQQNKELAA